MLSYLILVSVASLSSSFILNFNKSIHLSEVEFAKNKEFESNVLIRGACRDDTQCAYDGICKDAGNYKICVCKKGLTGNNCEVITDCARGKYRHCRGENGTCLYLRETQEAVCVCSEFQVFDKKRNICREVRCEKRSCHGGICRVIEGNEICTCPLGYLLYDDTCVESICAIDPIVCPEDSTTCVPKGDDYYCKCLPDFELREGRVEESNKEACKRKEECNFGFPMCPEDTTRCVPKGSNDFYCDCLPGFKLKDGMKTDENKESCLKLSKCEADPTLCPTNSSKCVPIDFNEGFYCECLPGFKRNERIGDQDNKDVCIREDITEGTSTLQTRETTTLGTFSVASETPTLGPEPETTSQTICDCGSNSTGCKFGLGGNKLCECLPGYAQRGDVCAECHCGPNSGRCQFEYNGYKVCQCYAGYAQRGEGCSKTCRNHVDCLYGGFCRKRINDYFCSCRSGFMGDRCERNELCEHLNETCRTKYAVCNYTKRFGEEFCECHLKIGNRRKINTCDEVGCKFDSCIQGKCQVVGHYLQCKCNEGFTGPNCDTGIIIVKSNNIVYVIVAGIFFIVLLSLLCGTFYLCIDICKVKRNLKASRLRNELPGL